MANWRTCKWVASSATRVWSTNRKITTKRRRVRRTRATYTRATNANRCRLSAIPSVANAARLKTATASTIGRIFTRRSIGIWTCPDRPLVSASSASSASCIYLPYFLYSHEQFSSKSPDYLTLGSAISHEIKIPCFKNRKIFVIFK